MEPENKPTSQDDMTVKYAVTVNREKCVGDGLFREKAPSTFGKDDEGKTTVIDSHGDPAKDIFSAAESCRMYAIILHDINTNAQLWP